MATAMVMTVVAMTTKALRVCANECGRLAAGVWRAGRRPRMRRTSRRARGESRGRTREVRKRRGKLFVRYRCLFLVRGGGGWLGKEGWRTSRGCREQSCRHHAQWLRERAAHDVCGGQRRGGDVGGSGSGGSVPSCTSTQPLSVSRLLLLGPLRERSEGPLQRDNAWCVFLKQREDFSWV